MGTGARSDFRLKKKKDFRFYSGGKMGKSLEGNCVKK